MKRDMDLVRLILIQVEESDIAVSAERLGTDDDSLEKVFYHIEMMEAHGLLDAKLQYGYNGERNVPYRGYVTGLTWDGHDYLDAIRNDTIWRKTKDVIKSAAGSVTMGTIKSTAVLVAEQAIKATLGL